MIDTVAVGGAANDPFVLDEASRKQIAGENDKVSVVRDLRRHGEKAFTSISVNGFSKFLGRS